MQVVQLSFYLAGLVIIFLSLQASFYLCRRLGHFRVGVAIVTVVNRLFNLFEAQLFVLKIDHFIIIISSIKTAVMWFVSNNGRSSGRRGNRRSAVLTWSAAAVEFPAVSAEVAVDLFNNNADVLPVVDLALDAWETLVTRLTFSTGSTLPAVEAVDAGNTFETVFASDADVTAVAVFAVFSDSTWVAPLSWVADLTWGAWFTVSTILAVVTWLPAVAGSAHGASSSSVAAVTFVTPRTFLALVAGNTLLAGFAGEAWGTLETLFTDLAVEADFTGGAGTAVGTLAAVGGGLAGYALLTGVAGSAGVTGHAWEAGFAGSTWLTGAAGGTGAS